MGCQTLAGFGSREELEWEIVSSIAERPTLLCEVALKPENFSTPAGRILNTIANLFISGEAIDPTVIAHKVKPLGLLGTWVLKYNPMCIPAMTMTYSKILKDLSRSDSLDSKAKESLEAQVTSDKLEIFRDAVMEHELPSGKRQTLKQAMRDCFARLEKIKESGNPIGIPTGFNAVDGLLGGWHRQQLIVIAGRPGIGKSSFVLTTALHAAEENNGVFYLSGEEGIQAITDRIMSHYSTIPVEEIRNAKFMDDKWEAITKALDKAKLNITIEETGSRTIEELCIIVRQAHAQNRFDLLVVDHLQTLRSSNRHDLKNRHLEISLITQEIKNLAMSLNIPVMLCSQLNRSVESTHEKKPNMAALKESGDIEGIADIVGLLYRPHYYDKTKDETLAELAIAKNRNGRTGTIELTWDGPRTTFKNREKFLTMSDDKWNT